MDEGGGHGTPPVFNLDALHKAFAGAGGTLEEREVWHRQMQAALRTERSRLGLSEQDGSVQGQAELQSAPGDQPSEQSKKKQSDEDKMVQRQAKLDTSLGQSDAAIPESGETGAEDAKSAHPAN